MKRKKQQNARFSRKHTVLNYIIRYSCICGLYTTNVESLVDEINLELF